MDRCGRGPDPNAPTYGEFTQPYNVAKAKQVETPHPLAKFGMRRPPHWLWRLSPRLAVIAYAAHDIWLILTGRLTLHRAWQLGLDCGRLEEYRRTHLMGGR